MLWFSNCGPRTSITRKFLRNIDFQTPPHYSWIWVSANLSRPPWWLSGKEFTCQCRRWGFHPWSGKIPHATEQLSLCIATTEPAGCNYWSTCLRAPCSATKEAAEIRSLCATTREEPQLSATRLEKSPCSNEDPAQTNKNKPSRWSEH